MKIFQTTKSYHILLIPRTKELHFPAQRVFFKFLRFSKERKKKKKSCWIFLNPRAKSFRRRIVATPTLLPRDRRERLPREIHPSNRWIMKLRVVFHPKITRVATAGGHPLNSTSTLVHYPLPINPPINRDQSDTLPRRLPEYPFPLTFIRIPRHDLPILNDRIL